MRIGMPLDSVGDAKIAKQHACILVVTRVSVASQILGSSLHGGTTFLGFNDIVLSVVGDTPIDSEVPVVTSSISKICRLSLLEDPHRGRVCVRMFIGMSVCCCECLSCIV